LGESCGGAQRPPLAAAADPQGRVWLVHRLGLPESASELVVPAREICGLLRQQADDDLARFLEPVAALGWAAQLDAVGAGLFLIPPGADAEFKPAGGHDVEGGGHVGQDRGMTVVNEEERS